MIVRPKLERIDLRYRVTVYRPFAPYRSDSLDGGRPIKCNFRRQNDVLYSADENGISRGVLFPATHFCTGQRYVT